MLRFIYVATKIDGNCLYFTYKMIEWFEAWGLSQKWLERVLIAVMALVFISNAAFCLHEGGHWKVSLFIGVAMTYAMLHMHQRPQSVRVDELRNIFNSLTRWMVAIAAFSNITLIGGWCLYVHDWMGFLRVFDTLASVTLLVYVLSLPYNDGERKGRKAKLAKDALLRMFGMSWVPEPEPMPS